MIFLVSVKLERAGAGLVTYCSGSDADMGLLTDSRAGAGDGSARTGDVTRGRDHSTLCQPTRDSGNLSPLSVRPTAMERVCFVFD